MKMTKFYLAGNKLVPRKPTDYRAVKKGSVLNLKLRHRAQQDFQEKFNAMSNDSFMNLLPANGLIH